MAVNFNPAIVTNGLTFAFDMGNTKKSWFGAPTTNLAKNSDESIDWGIGNLTASVSRSTVTANEVYRITSTTAGAFRFYFNLAKLVNGQTYMLSFKYRFISQNASQSFYLTDWNDTSIITTTTDLGDGIFYHTGVGSRATYDNTYRFMDGYISASTIVEIWDFQLEQSSIATPYTKYQRTNTESIVDMTSNSIITSNSLTYDGEGNFMFNGISDYITMSNSYALGLNPFAIDIWLKRVGDPIVNASLFASNDTQTETNYQLSFNANGTIRMYIGSTTTTCGFIPDSTWTHYCFSREDATSTGGKSYINGVLDRTVDTSADLSQLINYRIGRNRGGTAYYNGYIASIKFYHNKSLSELEVMQNFSALRARFGV